MIPSLLYLDTAEMVCPLYIWILPPHQHVHEHSLGWASADYTDSYEQVSSVNDILFVFYYMVKNKKSCFPLLELLIHYWRHIQDEGVRTPAHVCSLVISESNGLWYTTRDVCHHLRNEIRNNNSNCHAWYVVAETFFI